MNILYISSKKNWGGIVTWMVRTSQRLQENGHVVWILSHPNSKLNKYAPNNINLISKKLGPIYNPFMIFFIASFIKKHKIDLIVTNIDKEVGIGGMACKICNIPNIKRVGREDDFNKRFRIKLNHRLFVDQCIVPGNRVITNSIMRAPWLKRDEFTTIYNGRNPQNFSFEEKLNQKKSWGLGLEDKIIGITCQLSKVKHVNHLIEAFSIIANKYPKWRLVITGDGIEKKNLKNMAKDLKINSKVIFAGFSNNPLQSASAYDIAMATSEFEGFPNTIVEYFAVAKPVISTDVVGVNEIIDNNLNGILIPFGNIELMIEKIILLINDENLRRTLSLNAQKTLKKKFTEDIMINKLEKLFLSYCNIKKDFLND